MAVKTFVGTGDDAYTASLDMHNQVMAWIVSLVPNTEIRVIENSDTGAKYKRHGVTSKDGIIGIGMTLLDSYSGVNSPVMANGMYSGSTVTDTEQTDLARYYDKISKKISFDIPYTLLPNGIYLHYGVKFGLYFCEEINEHIFFYNYRNTTITIAITRTGARGQKHFPGYTVPQPQPNKCTVSNAIYGGKLLSNMFAYNCNPILSMYNEVMLGGDKYFTLPNNCCIKL